MGNVPLPLAIEVRKEVNGVEMGVLSDGNTFLSMRSLSKLCGIANSTISETASQWAAGKRDSKLAQWLLREGFRRDSLYEQTQIPGVAGNFVTAFPEDVSMLILEWYAHEVTTPNEQARTNYRLLARAGMRAFVYASVGYKAGDRVADIWREFHDRLTLHPAPSGYFSVFSELSAFLMAAIRRGLRLNHQTVPDISVGRVWSDHWQANGLEQAHGARTQVPHSFPDYFPQAKSNPQLIWVYPVSALGDFRTWMENVYAVNQFPGYLQSKVRAGLLPPSAAELLIADVSGLSGKLGVDK
jgi:hypothetical protein